jgi:ubiquitin carboxyl-terminal hydrolase 2/21
MDYSNYSNNGLTGLVNLGNTCYINSSLQIMSHIYELNEYIGENIEEIKSNDNYQSLFVKEWYDLWMIMWNKNVIISPKRFIKIIQIISEKEENELFMGHAQNDSTEFLYFILQLFCKSLNKRNSELYNIVLANYRKKYNRTFIKYFKEIHENEFSVVDDLFAHYCKIEYIDQETRKIYSEKYEKFYIMDIALSNVNLNDCINEHFSDEYMNEENNNAYLDEESNSYKNVIKRISIYHFPQYLIIQLKRWNYKLKKNQRIIYYDTDELDLTKYNNKNETIMYNLFGIINHSGNIFGGHYFSYIKNTNGKWYIYNDTEVKEINNNNLLGNKNYCLVYRKKE